MPKPWVYDYIMCVCVFLKEPTNRPKKCVEKTRSSNWWQQIGHVERNDKKIEVYKKRRRGQKNEEKKQKKSQCVIAIENNKCQNSHFCFQRPVFRCKMDCHYIKFLTSDQLKKGMFHWKCWRNLVKAPFWPWPSFFRNGNKNSLQMPPIIRWYQNRFSSSCILCPRLYFF